MGGAVRGTPRQPPAGARRPPGITIAGFHALIGSVPGGRVALKGKSTDWLKTHVVVPSTGTPPHPLPCDPSTCTLPHLGPPYVPHPKLDGHGGPACCGTSYADALRAARPDCVGPANVFLSHAYDYKFLDVVDAAEAWAAAPAQRGGEPYFFYFDLLCVNQHEGGQGTVVPFEVLRDEFGGSVAAIGRTLLVLMWDNPIPLGRSWCVFEMGTTLRVRAEMKVIMPPADVAACAASRAADANASAPPPGAEPTMMRIGRAGKPAGGVCACAHASVPHMDSRPNRRVQCSFMLGGIMPAILREPRRTFAAGMDSRRACELRSEPTRKQLETSPPLSG
jgi:hypothetical protein